MGEAKRRGNRDQRMSDAIASQPTPEAMRVQMGFPETAKFHGYVVCLPDSGEFLAGTARTPAGISLVKYSPTPDAAHTWGTYRLAQRAAAQIEKHRTDVGYLFDNDNQWLLGFADQDRTADRLEA